MRAFRPALLRRSLVRLLAPLALVVAYAVAQTPPLPGVPDDHFLCYKTKDVTVPKFARHAGVALSDQFETRAVDVTKPLTLCPPTNKNGEGVIDAVTHLQGYKIMQAVPHVARTAIAVQNQFGQVFVDTIKADRILLPTAKNLSAPATALGPNQVDAYKCYKVRLTPGQPRFTNIVGVRVSDQFQTKLVDLKKPKKLCTPVSIDGAAVKNPDGHFLCYPAKPTKMPLQAAFVPVLGVFTQDTFGPGRRDTKKEDELCVPSLKHLPSTTTTTIPGLCGDGVVGSGEVCDGANLAGQTCASLGFAGGTLACLASCGGFDSTGCTFPVLPPPDPATIAPAVDASVPTELASLVGFLYTGGTRIQYGVGAGTIAAERAAALRGRVLDATGQPLSGVQLTILDHPEYGGTLSRTDGRFDLAVNGGGTLTVDYAKSGFLGAQRQATLPWQDFAVVPDVVLVALDAAVTSVDLSAAVPMQVHQASVVSDADGTRQATVLFPEGTQATMVLPGGGTQPVTTLHVRATEYTVGTNGAAAMPGALPPASGYTYAVDLTVDEALAAGASEVQFSAPVLHYVENFLGFPVGSHVPLGSYDRAQARWVPEDDGRVIAVLGVTGGLADVDTDGDGLADAGADIGVTTAERAQLAQLYAPGQTLWRAPITHFSAWDCNWPFGPPDGARAPQNPDPEVDKRRRCDDTVGGSIVECTNQVLRETLPVAGTPYTLNYASDRVPGRIAAHTLRMALSSGTVPASLKRIELDVSVAGRESQQTFPGAPFQSAAFTWDGRDAYGRFLHGRQPATVRVGYVYDGVYRQPAEQRRTFGLFAGVPITGSRTRQEVTLWQEIRTALGSFDVLGEGLGGWTIDVHHAYDFGDKTLLLGTGERLSAAALNVRAIEAVPTFLRLPYGLAVGPDGGVYAGDATFCTLLRVAPEDTPRLIAGDPNQACGYSGDGGPAVSATLGTVFGLAFGPDGSLYVGDGNNNAVRRIAPDGIITTVAGRGPTLPGYTGDGGPATQARLNFPQGVVVAPDGTLYVSDRGNHAIRRVGPDGVITTIAGTGSPGFGGDGGPAALAQLNKPHGLALDGDGNLYVADGANRRVRRIGRDGVITTIAGNGTAYGGDGGPALQAGFDEPSGVAVSRSGALLIVDFGATGLAAGRVRSVAPDGTIASIAGVGDFTDDGFDTLIASRATLSFPFSIAQAPDGSLWLSELSFGGGPGFVKHVKVPLPTFDGASITVPAPDGTELYLFDGNGRHVATRDTLTGAVLAAFAYDSAGRLVEVRDRTANRTRIEHDASGRPTAIVAPLGQRTAFTTDTSGYLASIADPAGETTVLTSTTGGLLQTFQTPRGPASHFTYDSFGKLQRDTDAAGGFQDLARTALADGFDVTRTTALGRQTHHVVEELATGTERRVTMPPSGLVTTIDHGTDAVRTTTVPDGTVMTVRQDADPRFGLDAPLTAEVDVATPGGLTATATLARVATLGVANDPLSLTSLTDTTTVNGRMYTRTYSAGARTVVDHTPEGRQRVTTLDLLGRVVSAQLGTLAPTTLAYDTRGRVRTVTRGSGAQARAYTLAYDGLGRLATVTDPLSHTVGFAYDTADRVVTQTLPDGRQVGLGYDANGNVTSVTPPGRPGHGFAYTPVDLEAQYTPPDVGAGTNATVYTYNLDRQLTQITRPDATSVTLGYDSAGRLETLMTPAATMTYGYDPSAGTLASVTTSDGVACGYTYDGALLTSTTWTGPVAGSVERTYDPDFRVSGTTVNGGQAVSLGYDQDGLLTQAGALSLTRDPHTGLVTGTTLGQVTDAWAYNAFGEPSTYQAVVNGNPFFAVQYTRDAVGRITQKVETVNGQTDTFAYTYDPAGRLTQVQQNASVTATYTYDTNGNRLTRATPLGTETGTRDAQDRLLTYADATYTYTANGELATKTVAGQTTTYGYDALGNLRSVELADGTLIEYVIDGQQRRVGKTVNGVLVQGFLYDDQLRVAAELDGTGAVVTRFVYGTRANVPEYVVTGGATYRLVTDHLGSPRLVINTSDGTVAQRLEYDEFGRVLVDTTPGFVPFGFGGGLYDRDTGLVRFGARDYDAITGRWVNKDPVRFEGGPNLYLYAADDPINWIDPSGLWRLPDYIAININVAIPTPWTGTIVGWSGTLSVDRYGDVFASPLGVGVGKSATFVSGSLTANWLNGCGKSTRDQLADFLTANGFNFAAGYWSGVSESWTPGSGSATGVGIVSPQVGVSYNYSFAAGNVGVSW